MAEPIVSLDAIQRRATGHCQHALHHRAPRVRRACVVLVDGLGFTQLTERSGHFPFLRSLLPDAAVLESVVPSTTAAAVTSIGTGLTPGQTGMLGYTVRDPGTGTLLNMIRWDQEIVPVESWQRHRSLAGSLAAPRRFVNVGPARFAGSGLNTAAFRGIGPPGPPGVTGSRGFDGRDGKSLRWCSSRGRCAGCEEQYCRVLGLRGEASPSARS